MKGNTGKIIDVDLTAGKVKVDELPEEYYGKYIGGSGLAAKLFWERGNFDAEPLSPEAMLIFMNGPFAGLKLSGVSRHSTAGRSPLTGGWGDSSCGGYLAPELRYAGYDGIAITGRAEKPSMLLIEDDRIEILDAGEYWGKETAEVNRALKEKYGKAYRTLVIGPAGENLVKYSIILNEGHHATGRAGFGAVMGSKNLKAIVVKAGKKEMTFADPEKVEELRKELNLKIKEALTSNVLHENGTAANLMGGMFVGDVPIRNWTSNFWEEASEDLTGSTLTETYLTKRSSCAFCSIACKRVVEVKEGPWAVPEGPGPEYETIVSFGTLIGSIDLAATCKAGRICNDLGIDTISAGGTIAWAMEAFERGDLTLEDTGGIELKWGDMDTVINKVVPMIAAKEGKLGALLAEGSVSAAGKIGKGSIDYTVQCKGLEAPMHDPRGGGHGLALTYAMGARGACHVAEPMLHAEMGSRYYPEIGFEYELEPMTDKEKPEAAVDIVAIGSIENSACFCQFADAEVSIPEWLDLFNAVPGYNWDIDEMMRTGRRIFYLKRLINHRFGRTADDDKLTKRMLEPARDGEPEGVEINFDGMKQRFYELMKIDPVKAIPVKEVLEEYGMGEEAAVVW
ncbi:MAG: aldehyde ferredoxin oxidoreductase family protein [Deltaproteobacteria bacterium]|nr:aldehyde ferredoxin oxidoreductase family protein [Deltaproteobacteria bacterium]MBW2595434.1 aldehyde ferredoxin oxidoreductase family protein [Deltaproteobacteria bacterium]MBW2650572.1 aldehyde ferredoxin oxidoreductase family protein [Deltaproteobacteria bacterium]